MRWTVLWLAVSTTGASAQQMTVRARDVSPPSPVVAPSGGMPSGGVAGRGGPYGGVASGGGRREVGGAGGPWSAWPSREAWRTGGAPAERFTGQGQVAAIAQPGPLGAVALPPGAAAGGVGAGAQRGAWFPPRMAVVLLPTCDGWGNCWRQPTQVQAVWHSGWQRYVWIDRAGNFWPL